MHRLPLVAALFLSLLALPARAEDAFPQEGAPLPVTANDPQIGPREAALTVVALSDLEPGSARFTAQTLDTLWPALEKRYGKKVRLVFAHLGGSNAARRTSTEASIGVWTTTNVKTWTTFIRELSAFKGTLDANALAGLAALSGVKSRDRFLADLNAGRWRAALDEGVTARQQGTKDMRNGQVRVNGQLLAAVDDPALLFWHLDRELAATEAAKKRGIKARDLYGYRTSQNLANPVLSGVRIDWKDATGPETPRSPTITGTSIGPFKLGMTRAAFDALELLTEDRSSGWTCVSVEAPNKGRCSYGLYFDAKTQRLKIAEYNPGVANDGFRVKGKHITRDATLEEAIAALGCGEWSSAEGAASVKCGETLFITLGSGTPKEGRPFPRLSSADPTDKVSYSPLTLRLDAGWER